MKYIIELEDEPMGKFEDDENYYRCKQIPYWSLSETMINKLIPYTNIDIKEKAEEFGRGYDAGWDEGSKFHEAEKESIEDEVWELARRIICPSDCCEDSISAHTKEIFNKEGWEIRGIFNDLSYQEAKDKYDEWKKQKNEIHVGDEVIHNGEIKTVLGVLLGVLTLYDSDGFVYYVNESDVKKTGKRHGEVEELLKKMRGE